MSTILGTASVRRAGAAAGLDVGGEVVREGAQQARHDPLLLDGEVAAVAVGHDPEPLGDDVEVAVAAAPAGDPFEGAGDRAGAELARRALAARLDPQEPRQHRGDLDHARRVVVDDEPGRAEPAADGLEVLVAERRVELVGGDDRVRHARDAPPGTTGPAAVRRAASSTADSGVPSSTSITSAYFTSPTTVQHTVPGDCSVPRARNHSGPRARCGRRWRGSRRCSPASGWRPPRRAPRPAPACGPPSPSCGAVAKSPWRYGGIQRGSGSLPSMTSSSAFSSPKRYSSGPVTMCTGRSTHPGLGDLGQRLGEAGPLLLEAGLGGDVGGLGVHGAGGDQQPLHHDVRVRPQERPVLERSRLALGRVAHGVTGAGLGEEHRRPLGPRREPGAAPPAQAGQLELLDERPGGHRPSPGQARRHHPCRRTRRANRRAARGGGTRPCGQSPIHGSPPRVRGEPPAVWLGEFAAGSGVGWAA